MENKVFADSYSCSFRDPGEFLGFLKDRKENSMWMTAPSKSLHFQPVESGTRVGNLYMQVYQNNGRSEILADTREHQPLLQRKRR